MPCFDPLAESIGHNIGHSYPLGYDVKHNSYEEQLCDARDLLFKLHSRKELTDDEIKRLSEHRKEHIEHRRNDVKARKAAINEKIDELATELVSSIGVDSNKQNDITNRILLLKSKLSMLDNLKDDSLVNDRFCDRID